MKRSFYLPALTNDMQERLLKGMASYFRFNSKVTHDKKTEQLVVEKCEIGLQAADENQWDRISAYVNGFVQAVS